MFQNNRLFSFLIVTIGILCYILHRTYDFIVSLKCYFEFFFSSQNCNFDIRK